MIAIEVCILLLLSKKNTYAFLYSVFMIAGLGILCAIIGHYGTVGFNWKWFVFFDLPLYLFLIWTIVKGVIPMTKQVIEILERKENNE